MKNTYIKLLLLFCIFLFLFQCSIFREPVRRTFPMQEVQIIPAPNKIKYKKGHLNIKDTLLIVSQDSSLYNEITYLQNHLDNLLPSKIYINSSNISSSENRIFLEIDEFNNQINEQGYTLDISENKIKIIAQSRSGLFYGIQTFFQILPSQIYSSNQHNKDTIAIPKLNIIDTPKYKTRIMHLDLAHTYFSLSFLKDYIDYLAYHKINYLHLLFSDGNNWSINIQKYPKLTPNYDQKYYTQDEIKELIQYAHSRHISIIPEINLHVLNRSFFSSYPNHTNKRSLTHSNDNLQSQPNILYKDNTANIDFMKDILREIMNLFPSEYIHIGGYNPSYQLFTNKSIYKNNFVLSKLSDLPRKYLTEIQDYINSQDKKLLKWNFNSNFRSAVNISNKNSVFQNSQRLSYSPDFTYISFNSDSTNSTPNNSERNQSSLKNIYDYSEDIDTMNNNTITGIGAFLYTNKLDQPKQIEAALLPKLSAFSEIAWSQTKNIGWYNFSYRLQKQYKRYMSMKTNFTVPAPKLQNFYILDSPGEISITNPLHHGKIHYTFEQTEPSLSSPICETKIHIDHSSSLQAATFLSKKYKSSTIKSYILVKNQSPPGLKYGLKYSYYEKVTNDLEKIDKFSPFYTGTSYLLDIEEIKKRNNRFSVKFTGLLDIDEPGQYTFYITSDNGSKLVIADEKILQTQNFIESPIQNTIFLNKGFHPITLYYNEKKGGENLDLEYSGPDFSRRKIPPWKFLNQK